MTEITHEALNEIADALRRGCDGSIPIEAAEKLECIADALRTGQLIHAVPSGDEVEAVKDAARYRWLRDHSVPPHNFYISVPEEFHGVKYGPDEVDAYIDAAINALDAVRGKQ